MLQIEKEIQHVLNGSESVFTYDYAVTKKMLVEFNDFINRLAFLYKNNSGELEKKRIKNFFYIAFNPYKNSSNPSYFLLNIGKWAGIKNLTYTDNDKIKNLIDMIADVIFNKLESSVDKYQQNKGNFKDFLVKICINGVIDRLRDEYKLSKNGEENEYAKEYSLDDYVDSENRDERMSDKLSSGEFENEEKEENFKNVASAINDFVHENIKSSDMINFYDLFVVKDLSYEEIEDETGLGYSNLRQLKYRLESKLTEYVKNGALKSFVYNRTGFMVKFPENVFKITKEKTKKYINEPLANLVFDINDGQDNINEIKFNMLNEANNCVKNIISMIYEGYEVDLLDPTEHSKKIIDEILDMIKYIINNLNELNEMGYDFSKEYEKTNINTYNVISNEIEKTVPEIIFNLKSYTEKLNHIAKTIKKTYV